MSLKYNNPAKQRTAPIEVHDTLINRGWKFSEDFTQEEWSICFYVKTIKDTEYCICYKITPKTTFYNIAIYKNGKSHYRTLCGIRNIDELLNHVNQIDPVCEAICP